MLGGIEAVKGGPLQVPDVHSRSYPKLLRRFVFGAVICSVLPLLVVGWISYLYYAQFSMSRMAAYFQRTVEYNRKTVESFLDERTSDLKLVAFTHSLDYLKDASNLGQVFHILNREGSFFTDLGVIGLEGKHLAYVGPYDLMDKDYSQTFWFKEVMAKGVYVSDVFMGYREIPHFIIAVLCRKGGATWILRATIYQEFLSSLVETAGLGQTGEVFLVNKDGIYQTSPKFKGKIMDKAAFPMESFTGGSGILSADPIHPPDPFTPESGIVSANLIKYGLLQSSSQQIVAYSWLRHPQWLLVVKQDFSEVFGDINRVNTVVLILLHSCVLAILIVSVFTTGQMVKTLKRRDNEAEELNRQLMQASKLASIGELAAGVAHEINNPLAVILTENQVILDLVETEQGLSTDFKEQFAASLGQIDAQVERCSHITQNLLRFSRRIALPMRFVDLNAAVKDVVGLLEKRAGSRGVQISVDFQEDLPSIRGYDFELEQVFVNLIGNAIDAHEGKPYGSIRITTRRDGKRQGVIATVADTGSGISAENLARVFDPFFTTKPVGQGTGLGLSISYSIIRQMGGAISVRSEEGKGSEFEVFLPCRDGDPDDSAQTRRKESVKRLLAVPAK
ncbi:MAG: two-component sensor histidine kinase [Deltaproteobacteria bacterium]|nr:two-component sensor histidine kinase [Deltaproteobacteria bacterium]